MPSLLAYFAPFALLIPMKADQPPRDVARMVPVEDGAVEPAPRMDLDAPGWRAVESLTGWPWPQQVRIERRMTIRISPISPAVRENMVAQFNRPQRQARYVERKMGKCLPLRSIAAAQSVPGDRLMLYLRDQRIVRASLEKSCRAQDFYSGFYVEPSKDGMLCIDRDKLQARSGAKCELSGLRQMVLVTDQ